MNRSRVYFVGKPEEVAHHAEPLVQPLGVEVISVEDARRHAKPGDVCLFFNEFFDWFRLLIEELNERGCATLYALDGILEWRNAWEFPPGAACLWTMRPVLSHKVACIGRSQARVLESWGNLGKCEVVGVPRFDRLSGRQPRPKLETRPLEVLVMTAKNPGFTDEQRQRAKQSLLDLKRWFQKHRTWNGQPLEPRWRLTANMAETIGVRNDLRDTSGSDLATTLQHVDAVITTPSTSMLEAMLQGVPVALLDYNNCPHYVPAAWRITATEHLDRVLPELLSPPSAKMLYQDSVLHDALECRTPATPRMVELIEQMQRIAHECLQRGEPVRYPQRLLSDPQQGHVLPEEQFDLRQLYPNHPTFADLDRWRLQVNLAQARIEIEHLASVVAGYERQLQQLREAGAGRKRKRLKLRFWRKAG